VEYLHYNPKALYRWACWQRMSEPRDTVIVSAVRTPIGRYQGGLATMPAVRLGAHAITAALAAAGVEPEAVDEVLMGHVITAGLGQNPARQAAVYAGIPYHVGATTINKVCGSSMKALMIAANAIRVGEHDTIVVGGMESMSLAPYLLPGARTGYRLNHQKVLDAMVHDGLWDFKSDQHMGGTGDRIAARFDLSREAVDAFAAQSHQRAHRAATEGWFADELTPVTVKHRKGETLFDHDDGVRPDTTAEGLARLRPVFTPDGVVTAGNASQLSDGGAACVVMARETAEARGLTPLATLTGQAVSGCAPKEVMWAPVPTVRKLWEQTGHGEADYDLYEHNEAFASASLGVAQDLGLDLTKLNVHGGAVAMGHPLGCSGIRVVVTLLHALRRTGGSRGFATACLGGGLATAVELELP